METGSTRAVREQEAVKVGCYSACLVSEERESGCRQMRGGGGGQHGDTETLV